MKIGIASTDIGVTPDEVGASTGYTFPGGSFWYRISAPITYTKVDRAVGHITHNGKILGIIDFRDPDLEHWDCDVIIMQRCMWKGLPEAIMRARANGQVIINDIDDWFDGLPPSNQAFRLTGTKNNEGINREIYKAVLASSSALICSTPFLVDQYQRFRRPTFLWRNAMDFESFPWRRTHEDDQPIIGWLGNLNYRARDVEQLRGIIGPYLTKRGLTFHHVGHSDDIARSVEERMGIAPAMVTHAPSVSFMELSLVYPKSFDIGIVPLEPIRFNMAKSALKGMEYVASGIPYVASAHGEYLWMHEHGVGRLARRPNDWGRHFDALLDPDARRAEAERNLLALHDLVDMNRRAPEWLAIVESVTP